MEIHKLEAFFTVKKLRVNRNFSFRVVRASNTWTRIAEITIPSSYYEAAGLEAAEGDACRLEFALNGGKRLLIFEGAAVHTAEADGKIKIEARFSALKEEALYETYKDISYKEAFGKLSEKIDFRPEDRDLKQAVFRGAPAKTFLRLIEGLARDSGRPVCFWQKREGSLVISEKEGGGRLFRAGELLRDASADTLALFPIPDLEIGDTLDTGQGQYTVLSAGFAVSGRADMFCSVRRL